ncbi:hypothetical protein [Streptomyces afghaniensis]|uniref:hypothetical protein n=1 Tax=Streptomyces afghaniensis TaxID=66865 RepID=UPI00277F8DA0|nr:hypothetical protein [Streptomyces afghaniensis]MDQ1019890.1 hypothetical protein [Streptomyces afghaniensis]
MPQTPRPVSVGRTRATSLRPLADVDLLVQLTPLQGSNPGGVKAFGELMVAALQLRGKFVRHGIVEFTAGSGKTQLMGTLLRSVLLFSEAKAALDEVQDQRSAADLTWRLLSSAE